MGYKEYNIVMAIMHGDLFQLLTTIGGGGVINYSLMFIDGARLSHGINFVPSNMTFIDSESGS